MGIKIMGLKVSMYSIEQDIHMRLLSAGLDLTIPTDISKIEPCTTSNRIVISNSIQQITCILPLRASNFRLLMACLLSSPLSLSHFSYFRGKDKESIFDLQKMTEKMSKLADIFTVTMNCAFQKMAMEFVECLQEMNVITAMIEFIAKSS